MPDVTQPGQGAPDIVQNTLTDLRRLWSYRRQYDQRRALFYRQYVGSRDAKFYPDKTTSRSNISLRYPYSNVETVVSQTIDAFFSVENWFETEGRTSQDELSAEQMQENLKYSLHRADLRSAFETLVRNVVIYGHSGWKVDWDWDSEIVTGKEPQFVMQEVVDPQTGQIQEIPVVDPGTNQPVLQGWRPITREIPRACPKFIPIDIYDLLVDPDGRIVAHMTEKTLPQMLKEQKNYKAQTGQDLYLPEGIEKLGNKLHDEKRPEEINIRIAEVWNQNDNGWTILTFGEDKDALGWKDARASHRAMSYSAFRPKVYMGECILLYAGQNPFMHKRCPIPHTSFSKLPNEVYGIGEIEIITEMVEGLDRFSNMIVDNWNLGINKRYAYDINADIDHTALNSFNVPGGKVGVSGDPSKVIFPLPTHTPQQGDYTLLELYRGVIEMASGISDFYSKGVGSSGGNRTATGIAQITSQSGFRFKMFIRNLIQDIIVPSLEMCASMIGQFQPDQVAQYILKSPELMSPVVLKSPEGLYGNFNFNIVAADYVTNKVVKQRNLMALAGTLANSSYINEGEAIREILKAFELRNPRLVKSDQQVQQEQMAAQQAALAQQQAEWDHELQMTIVQAQVSAASKPVPKGEGKAPGSPPILDKFARRGPQKEGKIPGGGTSSAVRSFAQNMGANALGLEGLGEVNNG